MRPWLHQARRSGAVIKYDYEDLLILEELQVDARQSLGKISRELKMPYPQVYNHYNLVTEGSRSIMVGSLHPQEVP